MDGEYDPEYVLEEILADAHAGIDVQMVNDESQIVSQKNISEIADKALKTVNSVAPDSVTVNYSRDYDTAIDNLLNKKDNKIVQNKEDPEHFISRLKLLANNAAVSANDRSESSLDEDGTTTDERSQAKSAKMTTARIDYLIDDSGAGSNKTYAQKWISTINPTDFLNMTLRTENQDRAVFDTRPGDYGKNVIVFADLDDSGNINGKKIRANKDITVFDSGSVINAIKEADSAGRLLYFDKKRSSEIAGGQAIIGPDAIRTSNFETNIAHFWDNVNWKKAEARGKAVTSATGAATKTPMEIAFENAKQQLRGGYSETDSEYMNLAKDPEKNRVALQKMVDEEAKNSGAFLDSTERRTAFITGKRQSSPFSTGMHRLKTEGSTEPVFISRTARNA